MLAKVCEAVSVCLREREELQEGEQRLACPVGRVGHQSVPGAGLCQGGTERSTLQEAVRRARGAVLAPVVTVVVHLSDC